MTNEFEKLGIATSFLISLQELKISTPTEIQQKTIPQILENQNDIVAIANTGTGKTIAYGLPLLQSIDVKNNDIQVVILVPTRELGNQISANLKDFSLQNPLISIGTICGGVPIKPQIELLKKPTHIIVATPGRLLDLLEKNAISISNTKVLVLDEADEMISILKESLDKILENIHQKFRTLLFSATMPGSIKQLVQNYLNKNVISIEVKSKNTENQLIEHQYIVVDAIEKLDILMHFLISKEGQQGIIFCKTKAAVNKLAKNLAINKFSSGALHGSLSQGIRDRIMEQFRSGYIKTLIATDLASRGLDIKNMAFVINYHLPDTFENYTHRTGRTGRAGTKGLALTILQEEEFIEIKNFEHNLNIIFEAYQKPTANNLEINKTILWAKQIFKTKPNHTINNEDKDIIKTIFHHLTKDELIEKLIANCYKK